MEYLYPYTRVKGIVYEKLVNMVELRGVLFVEVDTRTAFPIPKLKDRVTSYLRRNGFRYVETDTNLVGYYQR